MLCCCWSSGETFCTILVCISEFIRVPVINFTHFHRVELSSETRVKRDFRITTTIIAAIQLVVARGAVITASLFQEGVTSNALNIVIEGSAVALHTQQFINAQFHMTIMFTTTN